MGIDSLPHVCLVPVEAGEGARCPRTDVADSYELPCRFWELNLQLLKEKPVLLTAELSLQL